VKKSRYTEEQTAFALRQAEHGTPVKEVIRKMGISEQTFYRWKKKYGGLGTSEFRRLKMLEEENHKRVYRLYPGTHTSPGLKRGISKPSTGKGSPSGSVRRQNSTLTLQPKCPKNQDHLSGYFEVVFSLQL